MELQEPDPQGRWCDHPGALGACGCHRAAAAAADHHGAQEGLAEGRHPRTTGPRGAIAAAAHGDVHRDDRSLVALGQQVDRQVVENPPVDEQPSGVVADRAIMTGSRVDETTAGPLVRADAPGGCE